MDLRDFVFSAPFGIGPVGEYALTGKVSFSPSGYATWMAMDAGLLYGATWFLEGAGTTKLGVYGPAFLDAFYGSTGLFTAFPALGTGFTAVALGTVLVGGSVIAGKAITDATIAVGGKPHRTSFTGQPSGPYFDY